MPFKTLLLAALAASGATAQGYCGTPSPTQEEKLSYLNIQHMESAASLAKNASTLPVAGFNVKVYWHVITNGLSLEDGHLTRAMLDNQLQVLNDDFAWSNISFTAADADWINTEDWAFPNSTLAECRSFARETILT
jgi:hypothetical protein